jgi:hypothetical protein
LEANEHAFDACAPYQVCRCTTVGGGHRVSRLGHSASCDSHDTSSLERKRRSASCDSRDSHDTSSRRSLSARDAAISLAQVLVDAEAHAA